jgi:hypothetical protein
MNIRKLLYLPNHKHIHRIAEDVETIMGRCDVIASQEFKEQKENQRTHDGRCPRCRAMQDKIVDKIRNVEGQGKVGGDFYLGFGSISGRMEINSEAVNYCKTCKHEWKKFKIKYVHKTDIVRVALNYLAEIIDDPAHNKRMTWKTEACQVFDGCSAESIRFLRDRHEKYLRINTMRVLKIGKLRKYYPSIFDGENKKELEKI